MIRLYDKWAGSLDQIEAKIPTVSMVSPKTPL